MLAFGGEKYMSLAFIYSYFLYRRVIGRCRDFCPTVGFDLALALALLLALLLTGCGTARISTTVHPDGSGVRRISAAMDETLYRLLSIEGNDPLARLKQQAATNGAGIEPFGVPGQTGLAFTMPFADIEALSPGLGVPGLERVQLQRRGLPLFQTFEYTAHIDTSALPGVQPFSLPGVLTVAQGAVLDYEVTLPGRILSHNASEVMGNTLIWHLSTFPGAVYDVQATSQQDPTLPLLVGMASLCIVLCMLFVIAVFVLLRSRRT